MSDPGHPYAGRTAVLATMHRKESVIAPALRATPGLIVEPVPGLDTDRFGTFSGEIARNGTMLEVAVRKARLGMNAGGAALGLATEGSFGPHPMIPFLPAGMELMVFVDDERGIVVTESLIAETTNFAHMVVRSDEMPTEFLQRIGFPDHGLIVRPNDGEETEGLAKGVIDHDGLTRAIMAAAAVSRDGQARLETDMRAHFNPTRMNSLAVLAERLGRRLARRCPACGMPGFGRTGDHPGLPCEACGDPTDLVAAEIFGCPACDFTEDRPRADGLVRSPAQYCPTCNP